MSEQMMTAATRGSRGEPGGGALAAERLPPDEVLAALGVDAASGLPSAEVRARVGRWGPNALRSLPPVPAWRKLLAQFADPLVLLLVAAAVLAHRD